MNDTVGGSINDRANIASLLGVAEGAQEMIDTIDDRQTNIESTTLGGPVAEHGVTGSSNGNDALITFRSELNELVSDLTREEEDIKGQLQWWEFRGKKRKSRVDTWLNEVQDLKKRAVDMNNSLDQLFGSANFDEPQRTEEVRKHKELTLDMLLHKQRKPLVLSNEFVGFEFEQHVEEMWELLEDEQVFIIGIHGMGGVGKTFLANYMKNEIERKETFKDVFLVNVSHDFTIFKLQHRIAETIRVKLYRDDEITRATSLSSELVTREKTLLILDDVWKYIDLQKVGIPLRLNGIKLIITTRLKHVCLQTDCLPDNIITIFPFCYKEAAWELFLLKLGHRGTPATLPPEVLEIAKSAVMKCDYLPLGISVMARTMKGGNDIHWWRHALNKLENWEMVEEMKEDVLTVLKRSYDNLIEKDMQKCFLYCALSLPDYNIEKRYIVMKLAKSGLLNGDRSLKEIVDEGHIIVDKLINHSLLLENGYGRIEMHGLVRNMVCHILNESHSYTYMVKCNENLRKIPHMREWTVDLEAVSLARNNIKEIPEGTSPNCPRLSTLILSDNSISHIPECFFTHMNALTLLDLSHNHTLTSLPHSLSNLRFLVSLVLSGCSKLKDIPPLGELQALSRLDISYCSILQVPRGLQNLINLKWLDLSCNDNLTLVPGCVLPGLTNMQYLDLRGCSDIKVEDVQGMSMLECFAGSFLDWGNYNRYVRKILDSGSGPETYLIHFGKLEDSISYYSESPIDDEFKRRSVCFRDCEELRYLLPRDLRKLSIRGNNQWECLCSALPSNGPSSLKNIEITQCTKLKSLFCLSCSSWTNIQYLESLKLEGLNSLTAICKVDISGLTQILSGMIMFSHLMHFEIMECNKIETLLTPGLVQQLRNLQSINVQRCNSMKEIFAVSNSGDDDSFNIKLPKLTSLILSNLPQLTTVSKGILVCRSENILDIKSCPKLEGHPRISLIVSDNSYSGN